jgi:hypothetical protein
MVKTVMFTCISSKISFHGKVPAVSIPHATACVVLIVPNGIPTFQQSPTVHVLFPVELVPLPDPSRPSRYRTGNSLLLRLDGRLVLGVSPPSPQVTVVDRAEVRLRLLVSDRGEFVIGGLTNNVWIVRVTDATGCKGHYGRRRCHCCIGLHRRSVLGV